MPEKAKAGTRPDWILNSIAGKTQDVEQIYKDGLSIGDFVVDDSDTYWNDEGVKNMFKTPDGAENRAAFDTMYLKERNNFLKLRQAEFDASTYKAQYSNSLSETLGVERKAPQIHNVNPDLHKRTFGFDFYDGTGFSAKQQGIRETAIDTGLKLENGQYMPVDEYDGLAKFAKEADGSYSLNEDGSTYLVPVKDGEELKANDQVYNSFTDWMGYYGHDYEWNQIAGSLAKNAIGFLATTMDSLLEFPKAVLQFTDEGSESDTYKDIVNFENWVKQFNPSMTEEGMEGGFWSGESLTDLSQQAIWQIGAMVLTGGSVGTAAKMLGAGANTASKIGSVAGKLLMTGMAAGPIADVARANGLSGKEAALLLGTFSAALYPIMALEEFVAYGKIIGKSHVGLVDTVENWANIAVKNGLKNKSTLRSVAANLPYNLKNALYKLSKNAPASVSGAVVESIEETAEQLVDIGVRNLYNLYSNNVDEDSWIAKKLGTKTNNKFQFDWVQEARQIGYSAVGGAMGGAIAAPLMRKFMKAKPDEAYGMIDMVIDGKENILYDFVNRMSSQGRLDYDFKDGDKQYTSEQDKSRNAEATEILKGTVDYLVKIRDDQQLDKLYDNNKAKAKIFKGVLETSSVGKDAGKLFHEILELDGRIKEMQSAEGSVSEHDLNEITNLRDEKQKTLDSIKRGEFVADYVAEGLYNLNAIGRGNDQDVWNRNILDGKGFVNLSKTSPVFVEVANEKISESNKQLLEADKSATVTNFNKFTEEGKTRVLNNAEQDYMKKYDAVKPHIDAVNKQLADAGVNYDITTDDLLNPEIRDGALSYLENIAKSEETDQNIAPLLSDLIESGKRITAIKNTDFSEIEPEVGEKELLLNMVDYSEPSLVKNTNTPIVKKLAEQLALEKEMSRNGVSMSADTDQINNIRRSILSRMAQIKANRVIASNVNQLYKANDQAPIREISAEEEAEIIKELEVMDAETGRLWMKLSSQENQLRKAVLANFDKHYDILSALQLHFADSEFNEIGKIVENTNKKLAEDIERGRIDEYFHDRREMEHQIYEYGKENRFTILDTFNFEDDNQTKVYDYIRGVLAEDSNRIWNAYKKVVTSIIEPEGESIKAASDEQLVSIVSAVQGLAAQKYIGNKDDDTVTYHHNSYFLNAVGGAGKTALISPIIAGIYQNLYGGETFLTSLVGEHFKFNSKKVNLTKNFVNFYKQSSSTLGLNITKSNKDILQFIESNPSNTNLIVFDEVTLLGTKQLTKIQKALNKVNALRKESNAPSPLKILYTGDTNQNAPSQGEQGVNIVQGINSEQRHKIARSEPLTFSFRTDNDQVKLFNIFTRNIQQSSGKAGAIMTEYSRSRKEDSNISFEEGVLITDDSTFNRKAQDIISRLKTNDNLSHAVYITDKTSNELESWVVQSRIKVLTSEQSQGEEWKFVFYDPRNKKVFGKRRNLVPKKQLHTAATRTGRFFMVSLDEPSIKSRDGKVYQVVPITPEMTNREAQLKKIDKILGTSSMNVEVSSFKYDKEDLPKDVFSKEPDTFQEVEATDSKGFISEFLETRNKTDEVSLYTFYTVEGQEGVKRRALYDHVQNKSTKGYEYVLTLAKIGTPEYENYVHNNPDYNGSYALFIEGIIDGERAVLGTLPEEDLADFISKNNVLEGKDSISISLDPKFLTNARNFKPSLRWDTTSPQPLGSLKEQYGKSVTLGDIRVSVKDTLVSEAVRSSDDKVTAGKGEILLPISVIHNTANDISKALEKSPVDTKGFITISGIRKSKVPLDIIVDELEQFIDSKGKYNFKEGSKQYETFFAHDAQDRFDENGNPVIGRLVETINSIYEKVLRGNYKNFVKAYTRYLTAPDTITNDGNTSKEAHAKAEKEGDLPKNKATYLLADYMEAVNQQNPVKIDLFEQLFADIKQDDRYKDGFEFNPRIGPKTLENEVHAPAFKGLEELYDKYLITTISAIDHPRMRLSKGDLLAALGGVVTNPDTGTDLSTSLTGNTTDSSDNTVSDPDVYVDPDQELADPETASLYDFQQAFFPKALHTLLPEAIGRFKRAFYSSFFNMHTASIETPSVAMEKMKAELKRNAYVPDGDLSKLDPINDAMDRSKYIDHAISKNIDFLMNKYAPTIKKIDGEYRFVSSHTKNRSFNEKESFALLREGMTEMVKTQLENTRIVRKTATGYEYTDRYINPKVHVEEIIDAFKEAETNNHESIVDVLRQSDSEILQSVYIQIYSPETTIVGGAEINSLSAFTDENVFPMVNAMTVFFSSGEIFNIASVDLDKGESKIPKNPMWKKPNLIRQAGQNTMERVSSELKTGSISLNISKTKNTGTYTIDDETFIIGPKQVYDDAKVLSAFSAIGMEFVTQAHLDDILSYEAVRLQLPPSPEKGRTDLRPAKRNKFLMEEIIAPALENINKRDIKYIGSMEVIYRTIARVDGLHTSMDIINIGGNRVYRLRNTSPIFNLNRKLREREGDNRFSRNMLGENGKYEITNFYVKDGFKRTLRGRNLNKSNNALSWEETLEYDIIWGFADTLEKTKHSEPSFSVPLMVYSDGSSDVTPVVKIRDSASVFNIDPIMAKLFNSRIDYYTQTEKNVLAKWNDYLGTKYKTIGSLQKGIEQAKKPVSEIQKIQDSNNQGFTKNLHYIEDSNGNAQINPTLVSDIKLYKDGNLSIFGALTKAHYDEFVTEIDRLDKKHNLKERISKKSSHSADDIIKAFYYNWLAVSSEATTLTMGDSSQYSGDNKSEQFIDFTKRAKSQVSNHTMQVFRNSSWEAERARKEESGEEMDANFINEGMKLSRSYKVAYSNDPIVKVNTFTGDTVSQEIYDGATFVTTLTRIFQKASNGGAHGTNVSHVMKNITTAINNNNTTFIKNAEFEITPSMLREGTERSVNIVKGMLSPKFDIEVEMNDVKVASSLDYLTKILGVESDFSNITEGHFTALAHFLVRTGNQDVPIKELIPLTSVKTGGGATNNMESTSNLNNLVTEQLDIYNKGTQLDASKDATQGLLTKATTQLFNTLGLNWKTPELVDAVQQGLADIANEVNNDFGSLTNDQLESRLKNLVRIAQDTDNQNITYQHKLIEKDYSFDDRQILNRAVSLLNSELTKRGIAPNFQGGQYIIHPANGLINVYDNANGSISLKSKSNKSAVGRDLVFHAPRMLVDTNTGIAELEAKRQSLINKINAEQTQNMLDKLGKVFNIKKVNKPRKTAPSRTLTEINAEFDEGINNLQASSVDGKNIITLTDTIQYKKLAQAAKKGNRSDRWNAMLEVDKLLQNENWEEGYAEIILPTEMKSDFGLEEGVELNDINVNHFKKLIRNDRINNKLKPLGADALNKRAAMMMTGFSKRLDGLMIRIPTTGKHSALATRVVAFMNGSDNSVFVPIELLTIQGADQDIDKGSYLTYESVAGYIPTGNRESGEFKLDPFFTQAIPKWKTVRVDPKFVIKVLNGKTTNIDPILYKEIFKWRVESSERGTEIKINQHEQARMAALKNEIVDNMRTSIASPKNAIEGSVSVDSVLDDLRKLAKDAQNNISFDRDSYLSYAKMHEINQSGKALVGVFANSLKAYQIMYDVLKRQEATDSGLAGLDEDFSTPWMRFAALINAATDNAKEQILGSLGIGLHNAGMVSYMVATGSSFNTIIEFLSDPKNTEFMQDLKDAQRYDLTEEFFDPSTKWKSRPDLIDLYNKASEYTTLATTLKVNRDLPNSTSEMYSYKRKIQDFVNDGYKKSKVRGKFDLITFITNDTYADMQIGLYDKVIKESSNQFNILNVLKNSIHMRAYMKTFAIASDVVERVSNVTRISNKIADLQPQINKNGYRTIVDFSYGLAVESYMRGRTSSNSKYNLSTIQGRSDFVQYMGNTHRDGFVKGLKMKPEYKDNAFVHKIFSENIKKYKYKDSPQLRTYDLMNMTEQDLLTLQVGFETLENSDKQDLINYALITRKGAMGKGSIAQLFDPADTMEFNDFLKSFDIEDISKASGMYRVFDKNTNNWNGNHNSIPYSMNEKVESIENPVNDSKKAIPSNYIKALNDIFIKLNSAAKGSKFRTIRADANTTDLYKFFENRPAMTVSDLILFALNTSSARLKNSKSYLQNIYKGLTGNVASNRNIEEAVKRCS